MKVHYSSKSHEWETPFEFFQKLDAEFLFTLDPCCTEENRKCPRYFTESVDGLSQAWAPERVFMNPPYGRGIWRWMQKAHAEWCQGATVVCLVPSRTDTRWWHSWAMLASEIRYVKGRLYFGQNGNNDGRAPFPSAVVIFRATKQP